LPSFPANSRLLDAFIGYPALTKPLTDFHLVLLQGPSPPGETERVMIAGLFDFMNRIVG